MREQAAFPILDDEQMQLVDRIGTRLELHAGQTLIEPGQKDYPFFVVKSGEIEILEEDGERTMQIATHGPGEFSGDVDMLTGRSSLFTARATTDGVAYSLPAVLLRKLLGSCPRIGDMLLDAFQIRRKLLSDLPFVGLRVIGRSNAADTSRLREFLYKNHVPHTYQEASSEEGREQLEELGFSDSDVPVIRCNGHVVSKPSLPKLANCIGINHDINGQEFDLTIVGCGPSGLAAAVYAASEGIRVLVIDRVGPGGQAGSSSKIENFMGFPSGLSGSELANRGYLQALKFGATFVAPEVVTGINTSEDQVHELELESGQVVRSRCVLVSSGVTYRQLGMPGCQTFEGAGVYYAATSVEARVCDGKHAIVVGGGNSAGQAAMYLAERAEKVSLLIRGNDLAKSMSAYLCQRVEQHPRIEILRHTEVQDICGDDCVDRVHLRNNQTDEVTEVPCAGLFIFIGAKPHSDWLPDDILLDERGFVLTGSSFFANEKLRSQWPLERIPCDLETTRPGILASGDVRSGTTKRCGFAVGDGSLAVACVHRYLSGLS